METKHLFIFTAFSVKNTTKIPDTYRIKAKSKPDAQDYLIKQGCTEIRFLHTTPYIDIEGK